MCKVKGCLSIEEPFCSAHIHDYWECNQCGDVIQVGKCITLLGRLFCSTSCENEFVMHMSDAGRDVEELDDGV